MGRTWYEDGKHLTMTPPLDPVAPFPFQAHVQGGGEMGGTGYEDGQYLTFTPPLPFLACSPHRHMCGAAARWAAPGTRHTAEHISQFQLGP